jgi:hypothetical protein
MDEEHLNKAIKAVLDQKGTAWFYDQDPSGHWRGAYLVPGNMATDYLVKTLGDQGTLQRFNQRYFRGHNSLFLVSPYTLATWITDNSYRQGIDATLKAIKRYLALDYTPTVEILAVTGIEIQEEIELGNGIFLAPMNNVPSIKVREALTEKIIVLEAETDLGFSPLAVWMRGRKPPTAGLYCFTKLKPQTCKEDDLNHIKSLQTKGALYEACACLALIGPSAPKPLAYWSELEEWVPLNGYTGSGFSYVPIEVLSGSQYLFSKADLLEARNLYGQFLSCSENTRTKLRIPLARLTQAVGRSNLVDKALDLGVALESLLLNDLGSNEQLSLSLRIRGAWLLGEDANDRHRLERIFKQLYHYRSQAAHRGKFDKDRVKIDSDLIPIQDFLKTGEELCAAIIKKILEKAKFPEWNRLILGMSSN